MVQLLPSAHLQILNKLLAAAWLLIYSLVRVVQAANQSFLSLQSTCSGSLFFAFPLADTSSFDTDWEYSSSLSSLVNVGFSARCYFSVFGSSMLFLLLSAVIGTDSQPYSMLLTLSYAAGSNSFTLLDKVV